MVEEKEQLIDNKSEKFFNFFYDFISSKIAKDLPKYENADDQINDTNGLRVNQLRKIKMKDKKN